MHAHYIQSSDAAELRAQQRPRLGSELYYLVMETYPESPASRSRVYLMRENEVDKVSRNTRGWLGFDHGVSRTVIGYRRGRHQAMRLARRVLGYRATRGQLYEDMDGRLVFS